MRTNIVLPHPLIPDIESMEWRDILKKGFDIDLYFLIDDGICIEYDDEKLEPLMVKGDSVEFYEPKSKALILKYVENFGQIEFYKGLSREPFLEIKIIDEL